MRMGIVSVINIKASKHDIFDTSNQHALTLQPARQPFLKIKLC